MVQPVCFPSPAFVMTRKQIAESLGISLDALDEMHARGEGPPRFRASPRVWRYPVADFENWKRARMAEAEARRPRKPSKQSAAQQSDTHTTPPDRLA